MAKEFKFDGNTLTKAIKATFVRRSTDIPHEIPVALTEEFSSSPDKITQWQAFLRRSKLEDRSVEFSQIVNALSQFLMPPAIAAANNEAFYKKWANKWICP